MSRYVPIFISPSSLRITVFGGGNVALRKCRHFEGAEITVISETVLPEIEKLAHNIIRARIPNDVRSSMIGADMVIAATDDPDLNRKIRDSAKSIGIFANSSHGGGDLLIPSVLRRDMYTVAVSSEGNAPAFPPYLIGELNEFLDDHYDFALQLATEMRLIAKERIPELRDRRAFAEGILRDADILKAVSEHDMESARKLALKRGGLL